MDTFVGLDLGQLVDHAAASVVRRSLSIDAAGSPERDTQGRPHYRFDVSAIRRYQLGTPYTSVIVHLVEQLKRPEFGPLIRLVVDATGVGIAVMEMIRSNMKPLGSRVEIYGVSITAGRAITPINRYDWHVAKVQLIGCIRAALESGRLKIPASLEHAATLQRELADFQVRITDSSKPVETFSARQGAHDDLVLATALPIWLGCQPFLEMSVTADRDLLRPREASAVSSDIEVMMAAEQEALARERGELTPKMIAAARSDPWTAFTWRKL